MVTQDKFGLIYDRPPAGEYVGFSEDERNSVEFKRAQQDALSQKVHIRRLDEKSKEASEQIHRRLWASMWLRYLLGRIYEKEPVRIQVSDLPIQNLSLREEEHVPSLMEDIKDKDVQLKLLEQRRLDASIGVEAIWTTLEMMVSQLTLDITAADPLSEDIAFRAFSEQNRASYFRSQGDIRCANWKGFDIKRELSRSEAGRHIEGRYSPESPPTNFISISTSPRRLRKLVKWGQKIAVIDLRVLRRLGIAHGSTTEDLGFNGTKKGPGPQTQYATKHHALVVGWIPSRSILGFLSVSEFAKILEESRIETDDYDKKLPFELIKGLLRRASDISP